MRLATGTDFRNYRIDTLIGRGSASVVYRAVERATQRPVALKIYEPVFAPDPDLRKRFIQAVKSGALDHPNVLPVFDAGEEGSRLFVAMRFVEGGNLANLMYEEGALDGERALAILEQAAAGLDAVHRRGLVHGDLKPANFLIEAPDDQVYVTDFFDFEATGISNEAYIGTIYYCAPERIEGSRPDVCSDIYTFGEIVFETLTGQKAFDRGDAAHTLHAILLGEPPFASELRPELPGEVDRVLARALAKDPAARYSSCGELVWDLRAVLPAAVEFGRRRPLRTRSELLEKVKRVFISYSSRENEFAEAVCSALEAAGFKCWIAPRDIVPGGAWAASIVQGIDQSFLVVLVLSASSLQSQQVLREISYAADRGITVIPLRIEDVVPSGAMTYYLGPHQWLDAIGESLPAQFDSVVAAARVAADAATSA